MKPPRDRNDPQRETPRTEGRRTNSGSAPIDSDTLFGTAEALQIDHKGHVYTLRKTRNDKLILTK